MTSHYCDEQLDCTVEAPSSLLEGHRYPDPYNQEEVREILCSSKSCKQLSQEEIEIVVACICGLTSLQINGADKIVCT